MSRIGKQPIEIPDKTEVTVHNDVITVKGPLGELTRSLVSDVTVTVADKTVTLVSANDTQSAQALWGTYTSIIGSMIKGVNEPFEKKLVVEGIGYRAELQGKSLVLNVGFSHSITLEIPENLKVSVEKNVISVSGTNKEIVGQFAATIRATKKPEPYKGKGIRYEDEVVRRKQGKRAVT